MNPARLDPLGRQTLLVLSFISALTLSACGSPNRFLLTMPVDRSIPAGQSDFRRIGLRKVTMPEYANSEKIASLEPGSVILQDEENRWAESPEDAVARHLAAGIARGLEAVVVVEPYPRGLNPGLQIEVRFDRFLRDVAGNSANLSGQFILGSGDGREVVHIDTFSYAKALPSSDYAGYVSALNEGLIELSKTISEAALALEPSRAAE